MSTSSNGITLRNLLLAKSISIETLTNSSKLQPEEPAKLPHQEDGASKTILKRSFSLEYPLDFKFPMAFHYIFNHRVYSSRSEHSIK